MCDVAFEVGLFYKAVTSICINLTIEPFKSLILGQHSHLENSTDRFILDALFFTKLFM